MGCINTTVTLSQRGNLDKQDTQKEDDTKANIVAWGTGAQSLFYNCNPSQAPHGLKCGTELMREEVQVQKEQTPGDELIWDF